MPDTTVKPDEPVALEDDSPLQTLGGLVWLDDAFLDEVEDVIQKVWPSEVAASQEAREDLPGAAM